MPRQYCTQADLNDSALYIALKPMLNLMTSAGIDKQLFMASQRCDSYCKKRIQAPPTTTVGGTFQVQIGTSAFPLASTIGIDNQPEQLAIIGTGGTQETISFNGVNVTTYTSPYPGTLNLDTPTAFVHNVGEPVTIVYREVMEAGSVSSNDPYSEALLTQASQIALAHAPHINLRNLTRVVWLKNSPIIGISAIEHSYSFNNAFNTIQTSIESINQVDGWYQFNTGTIVMPGGLMRTTYTGGLRLIPEDVKQATICYFADLMQQATNPGNAISVQRGKVRYQYSTGMRPKTPLQEQAEDYLKPYRRRI